MFRSRCVQSLGHSARGAAATLLGACARFRWSLGWSCGFKICQADHHHHRHHKHLGHHTSHSGLSFLNESFEISIIYPALWLYICMYMYTYIYIYIYIRSIIYISSRPSLASLYYSRWSSRGRLAFPPSRRTGKAGLPQSTKALTGKGLPSPGALRRGDAPRDLSAPQRRVGSCRGAKINTYMCIALYTSTSLSPHVHRVVSSVSVTH